MPLAYRITKRHLWDPSNPDTTVQIEAEVYDPATGIVIGPPLTAQANALGLRTEPDGGMQLLVAAIAEQAVDRITAHEADPIVAQNLAIAAKFDAVLGVELTAADDIAKRGVAVVVAEKARVTRQGVTAPAAKR